MRDVQLEDIFKLMCIEIDVYIPHRMGQTSLISMVFSCLCCCHNSWKSLFCLYQQNKSSESKVKFRETSNHCKKVLKTAKLAYANEIKGSITSQKLCSQDFWKIVNSVLKKGKSVIPLLFNGSEVMSSASGKAKLFVENFSKNSNLDDAGIFLPVFPSRTNLKLHNISITPNMVKKVIMNLD